MGCLPRRVTTGRVFVFGLLFTRCPFCCLTTGGPVMPLALCLVLPGFAFLRQGDLGPFNPGLPVQVPLWLAINLKQRQKCRLLPPEWMDVGKDVGARVLQ